MLAASDWVLYGFRQVSSLQPYLPMVRIPYTIFLIEQTQGACVAGKLRETFRGLLCTTLVGVKMNKTLKPKNSFKEHFNLMQLQYKLSLYHFIQG